MELENAPSFYEGLLSSASLLEGTFEGFALGTYEDAILCSDRVLP